MNADHVDNTCIVPNHLRIAIFDTSRHEMQCLQTAMFRLVWSRVKGGCNCFILLKSENRA